MAFTPTRREFVKIGAMAGAGLLLARNMVWAFYSTPPNLIRLYRTTLRAPGLIPIASPDIDSDTHAEIPAPVTSATHYEIDIAQYEDQLHPGLDASTLRGYHPSDSTQPQKHLGGIIIATRDKPLQISFINKLQGQSHPIPIDTSLPGAGVNDSPNRAAVHLHGGLVPWVSDGGPFDWFDADGNNGDSFLNNDEFNPGVTGAQAEYYYPNAQSARMLWYHDHAYGITRVNAYAGVASAYLIRDTYEKNLQAYGLPGYIEEGGYELPLVVQDKTFVGPDILLTDPTWSGPTKVGSLWYPHVYEKARWKLGTGAPLPTTSCVPEAFGDTMLVNGTPYPEVNVEPRRYRLRLLNACNARFLNLQLFVANNNTDGITLDPKTLLPTNAAGPDFTVIGTEGGFLPKAVTIKSNVAFNPVTLGGSLITAPAERYDLLVDFSDPRFAGKSIVVYNDAPAPFPFGDPRYDFFPGAPKNPTLSTPGYGPNTRVLMRFNVTLPLTGAPDVALGIDTVTDKGVDPFIGGVSLTSVPQNFANPKKNPYGAAVVRMLTLNEAFDGYGRLIQYLGTNVPGPLGFARKYDDPPTEVVNRGDVEVWQIANLTGDTHPIHFHLVNVMVVARQAFKVSGFTGVPTYLAPPVPAAPEERTWKETVRMNPGEVTTVVARFSLPSWSVGSSPRVTGHEFVWHCHILEHEEHDMMRPLVVI